MGTGGATALQSPELNAEGFGVQFWCVIGDPRLVIRQTRLPILGSRLTIHVQFSKEQSTISYSLSAVSLVL
jgi:hypothetical protein